MDYKFVLLPKITSNRSAYTIGHAMIWQPNKDLRLQLIVSQAAIERDFNEVPFSNIKKYQKPGVQPVPHPGYSVREAIERFSGGLAYFNAGEMGVLNFPLIVDGTLVTKPNPAKALFQQQWQPLNETYTFFIQCPNGEVKIRDLPIVNNQLQSSLPKGTYGISAPYIVKGGNSGRSPGPK